MQGGLNFPNTEEVAASDLVAVHGLRDRRVAGPNQIADVLEPDIVSAEDGHEAVP